MNLRASNNHNVYILGAGFSVTAGLPLMGSFLNRMRDAHEHFQLNGCENEAQAIGEVLDFRLAAASAAYWAQLDLENIEQLFSLATAARDPVSRKLPIAIAATLSYCRSRGTDGKVRVIPSDNRVAEKFRQAAGSLLWNDSAPKLYRLVERAEFEGKTISHVAALLGMVNETSSVTGANTFITFNYDTLVEDALTMLEVPWTYGFEQAKGVSFAPTCPEKWGRAMDENAVPVLKLHGSVNWAQMDDEITSKSPIHIFESYDALAALGETPRLIPPTWSKNVEDELSTAWSNAVKRLESATRIFIIGFSMPETDLHFRYLLAAGLQKNLWLRNIVFVNPDGKGVEARARAILRQSYIDSNVISVMQLGAEEFARGLLGHGGLVLPSTQTATGRQPRDNLGFWTPEERA